MAMAGCMLRCCQPWRGKDRIRDSEVNVAVSHWLNSSSTNTPCHERDLPRLPRCGALTLRALWWSLFSGSAIN
eukprot:1420222-Pyramimonas_sp.AAC.1